jgi:hypothetical protein
MAFIFLILGLGLLVSAIRGTNGQAGALLKSEFTGTNSFIPWVLSIFILGGLGYIPALTKISRAFLLLIITVLILKKGKGFFAGFNNAISSASNINVAGLAGASTAAGFPAYQNAPATPLATQTITGGAGSALNAGGAGGITIGQTPDSNGFFPVLNSAGNQIGASIYANPLGTSSSLNPPAVIDVSGARVQ